jgi:hypothetical protein
MIKWIKNLKSKEKSFSEKKETRLEQMKKIRTKELIAKI